MRFCKKCGQSINSHESLCQSCNKYEKTTFIQPVSNSYQETTLISNGNDPSLTADTTKLSKTRMIQYSKVKHPNNSFIIMFLLVALISIGFIFFKSFIGDTKDMPSLNVSRTESEANSNDENIVSAPVTIPEDLKIYEGTSLLHPVLQKEIQFFLFEYPLIFGQTTPEEIIQLLSNMEYEQWISDDYLSLQFFDINGIDELFFEFNRSRLDQLIIVSTSGTKKPAVTGNGLSIGSSFEEMLQIYGSNYLSSSIEGELYEYLDLASKFYVNFQDLPDHKDGSLDYMFIQKYDLANPDEINSFEEDKIHLETKRYNVEN